MYLAIITISSFYYPGAILLAGIAVGYLIQERRVRHYREKQLKAEKEKLKMQAQMLGMGHLYE